MNYNASKSDYAMTNAYLSTEAVANWFIKKVRENGHSITVMKLQRLVYYAHGWCLALYKTALVKDQVEAWAFGPVFPRIYHLAKQYGSQPITSPLSDSFTKPSLVAGDDPRVPLLEKIWEVYGRYTDSQLSRMANKPDGPWHRTMQLNPGRRGTNIPDSELINHFSSPSPS